MTVCVECGLDVKTVVRELGPKNIRLVRCGACGRIADKYVEYDTLLILLDMLLHRTSVYRHLLCNRAQSREATRATSHLLASGVALLLCDAYLRWPASRHSAKGLPVPAAINSTAPLPDGVPTTLSIMSELFQPLLHALLGYCLLCSVATAVGTARLGHQV